MTKSISHIRYSRLLIEISDLLFSIHNLNTEISICNDELMACLEDPSMLVEWAALKKYIEDRQQQILTLRLQVEQLQEEGRRIRQKPDGLDYPEMGIPAKTV